MRFALSALSILLITSHVCSAQERLQVGDIAHDPTNDDPNFSVCNESQVAQYYNFGTDMVYNGEKPLLEKAFQEKISRFEKKGATGFLTIRFIVNCEGQAGRFRHEGMDMSFQPKSFDKTLIQELTTVIGEFTNWGKASYNGVQYDYYHYLTFKIEDGKIKQIMP
jgi:hypothetical protein